MTFDPYRTQCPDTTPHRAHEWLPQGAWADVFVQTCDGYRPELTASCTDPTWQAKKPDDPIAQAGAEPMVRGDE